MVLSVMSVTSYASQEVTSTNKNENVISEHNYFVDISFEGGTGKAYIKSPVEITDNNGKRSIFKGIEVELLNILTNRK